MVVAWGFRTRGCGWRPATTRLILVASAHSVELKGSGYQAPSVGRPACLGLGLDSGLGQGRKGG